MAMVTTTIGGFRGLKIEISQKLTYNYHLMTRNKFTGLSHQKKNNQILPAFSNISECTTELETPNTRPPPPSPAPAPASSSQPSRGFAPLSYVVFFVVPNSECRFIVSSSSGFEMNRLSAGATTDLGSKIVSTIELWTTKTNASSERGVLGGHLGFHLLPSRTPTHHRSLHHVVKNAEDRFSPPRTRSTLRLNTSIGIRLSSRTTQ